MVAEEVFVNCYNFNPFTWSKKGDCQCILKKLSGSGTGAGAEVWICGSVGPGSQKKYFRLRSADL
jgi:hypothetical protein